MRKRNYGLTYLAVMIVPSAIVFLLASFIDFNFGVIEGIVFTLSCLMAWEIDSEYQSKYGIWRHISNSTRNKIAFAISMVLLYSLSLYPRWQGVKLDFISTWVWLLSCALISFSIFILLATHDLRLAMLKKILPNKRDAK